MSIRRCLGVVELKGEQCEFQINFGIWFRFDKMHLPIGEVNTTSVTRELNIFLQQVQLQSRAGKSECKGFEYPLPL
jgi:hypothetical protein